MGRAKNCGGTDERRRKADGRGAQKSYGGGTWTTDGEAIHTVGRHGLKSDG